MIKENEKLISFLQTYVRNRRKNNDNNENKKINSTYKMIMN